MSTLYFSHGSSQLLLWATAEPGPRFLPVGFGWDSERDSNRVQREQLSQRLEKRKGCHSPPRGPEIRLDSPGGHATASVPLRWRLPPSLPWPFLTAAGTGPLLVKACAGPAPANER